MFVTPRSLRRRLRSNPSAVKVGAGVLASAIGVTTAAYGVLHVVQPYKGNGARSDMQASQPAPEADLVNTLLALIPTELPADGGSDAFSSISLDGAGSLVTSVVDSVNGSANGAVGGGSGGGGTGDNGGSGGGGNGLLGNIGGDNPTWTPPGGNGDQQGIDVPSVGNLTPGVPLPQLSQEGGEECPAEPAESTEEPGAINPHLPGLAPETEDPACAEEEAPAEGEQAPVEEEPAPAEEEAPSPRKR